MNSDQMPVNSARSEELEDFGQLPSAEEATRRTASKRRELAEPFEKAVAFARRRAAERIAFTADRGYTEAKVEGEEIKNVVKNVAARRVLDHLASELIQRGFRARVAGGVFTWDATLEIAWTCDTPDYRSAED